MLAAALLAAMAAPAAGQPVADPRLVEAIGWYTGTRGLVDDAKARLLIETTAFEGNVLARMWLARLYSRGRMGYPRDEVKARAIAEQLIDAVQRQAAAGTVEAVFLMGTAYDEGLGRDRGPANWRSPGSARRAATGHTLAEHSLGNAYAAGRGVTADPVLAVRVVAEGRRQGRCRAAAAPRRGLRSRARRGEEPRRGPPLVRRSRDPRECRRRRRGQAACRRRLTRRRRTGELLAG